MAKIKWALWNYHCDNCETGIVQIHQVNNLKSDYGTVTVSGCLTCKKKFGIKQASDLKPLKINIT